MNLKEKTGTLNTLPNVTVFSFLIFKLCCLFIAQ